MLELWWKVGLLDQNLDCVILKCIYICVYIFKIYIVNKFRVTLSSKQVVTVYDYCIRYKVTHIHLFNCNHPYNIINSDTWS